jgi:enoyl-CoA hydratase/carnithine racemase
MRRVGYSVQQHVAEISLDHAPVNTLTEPLLDELLACFDRAAADSAVRVVILRSGVAQRFSAGLDLNAVNRMTPAALHSVVEKLYLGLHDAQARLGKPSIAVVNGTARGGGMTLAISCDLIVAGRSATFGYPEIDVGVIPAIHYAHLPRIVGRHRAFDLLFTGRSFGADEAAALGLVSCVTQDDELLERSRALAHTLAQKPPGVIGLARAAFRNEIDRDYRARVAAAVENFCRVAATDEAREGVRAFVEKRAPDWRW